jgi:hypothetical protein
MRVIERGRGQGKLTENATPARKHGSMSRDSAERDYHSKVDGHVAQTVTAGG